MQVRIANRQDEKAIRELAETFSSLEDVSFDLKGKDSDLFNIEANYFGKEGLFLVAEVEDRLVGFSGARAKSRSGSESESESDSDSKCDEVLEVVRFQVEDCQEKSEIESEFIRVIVEFAPRLLYHSIECGADIDKQILSAHHFQFDQDGKLARLAVTPDF